MANNRFCRSWIAHTKSGKHQDPDSSVSDRDYRGWHGGGGPAGSGISSESLDKVNEVYNYLVKQAQDHNWNAMLASIQTGLGSDSTKDAPRWDLLSKKDTPSAPSTSYTPGMVAYEVRQNTGKAVEYPEGHQANAKKGQDNYYYEQKGKQQAEKLSKSRSDERKEPYYYEQQGRNQAEKLASAYAGDVKKWNDNSDEAFRAWKQAYNRGYYRENADDWKRGGKYDYTMASNIKKAVKAYMDRRKYKPTIANSTTKYDKPIGPKYEPEISKPSFRKEVNNSANSFIDNILSGYKSIGSSAKSARSSFNDNWSSGMSAISNAGKGFINKILGKG